MPKILQSEDSTKHWPLCATMWFHSFIHANPLLHRYYHQQLRATLLHQLPSWSAYVFPTLQKGQLSVLPLPNYICQCIEQNIVGRLVYYVVLLLLFIGFGYHHQVFRVLVLVSCRWNHFEEKHLIRQVVGKLEDKWLSRLCSLHLSKRLGLTGWNNFEYLPGWTFGPN